MAVRGKEGVVEGNDYRDVPVMAAIRKVPDTGWYFIAKMDLKEAYMPAERVVPLIVAFVIVGFFTAALGIGFFWRNQMAAYYRSLYKTQEILGESLERYRILAETSRDIILFIRRDEWKDSGGKQGGPCGIRLQS